MINMGKSRECKKGEVYMRLIHLSDLHIGKRVNEFSMLEDQEYLLTEILAERGGGEAAGQLSDIACKEKAAGVYHQRKS